MAGARPPLAAETVAVILAAGEGARIGHPKALLADGEGDTFLGRLARTFTAAGARVLYVAGARHDAVRAAHPTLPCVLNPRWEDGQWSSVRVGLAAALELSPQVVLVHPVDAPLIAPATVAGVVKAALRTRAAAAAHRGARGHPVALTAEAARAVLADGASPTLEAALARVGCGQYESGDEGVVANVNTPEDYRRLFGKPVACVPAPG